MPTRPLMTPAPIEKSERAAQSRIFLAAFLYKPEFYFKGYVCVNREKLEATIALLVAFTFSMAKFMTLEVCTATNRTRITC